MVIPLHLNQPVDIQLEKPLFIASDAPLQQAIALMTGKEKGSPQSCLVVQEDSKTIGILTERDLVRLSLSQKSISETIVREIMTSPVITITTKDFSDIFAVYSLMRRHRIRHLPVINTDDSVSGLMTLSMLRQALHLSYFLRFREVREVMSTKVITAFPTTPLIDVAQLMACHRISCVVIVDETATSEIPVGIITERDIVQLQGLGGDLATLTTRFAMSCPVISLHPENSLTSAQEIMQRYRVRRIVAVNEHGELEGVVTETNVSQILDPLELFGMLEILQHRVQQLVKDRDRLLPSENRHLQEALDNKEFRLHYQPQFHGKSRTIVGAEVLVRWYSKNRGIVSPAEFIPLAEMTGFIVTLGEWILKDVCQQARRWQDAGYAPIKFSVNVSSHQLKNPQFSKHLEQILAESKLDPQWLTIELTESSLVENVDMTLTQFQSLKELGVDIAIDDFGTGYASLGYLQHFPFDILKIDRCFVENIHINPKNAAITSAIIQMAEQLNFSVVAEGVERQEEFEFLGDRHCEIFQGYFFSPPLSAEDFEQHLIFKSEE
ncbi:diguanylate phosphodiesterase with CBS domains [[Leptolyngbya] sp. PCC 7376]|uniref:EAL domain-containing protein n=1 Tax=[Leptolyngbya] sp. PCC 7376 TaxID=111781 RepID=UPI00029F1E44|nr:EAL domain-containing protein [[Leptolyngbya] sp. PCC 7376]AFY38637.1 diguanylate phosphodiesterase with CBS domains [[Leptolyngbya] sp. PCC 7376]